VGGNTTDYDFNWYDGLTRKAAPDFTGIVYDSLAAGDYSVIAIDLFTLCESPLKSEKLISLPVYPTFVMEVEPTLCDMSTGSIYLTITNDVEVSSMKWYYETNLVDPVAEGPVVKNADNGRYTVIVRTPLGCEAEGFVDVKNEINPFNGISRNNDNLNSYFHINCIEDFPHNIVKIFNRAGTLVYESEGYDNNSILFDGISNKGIRPMGDNLPDGTYFYVIDKHDGSKPLAGYLEIVN
jgi:gliding motility-associated-like protein